MNRVCLYGIISTEPRFKEITGKNGKKYFRCNFYLSVNRGFKRPDETYIRDSIPIVLWGNAAYYVKNYMKKLDLCWIDGEFFSDKYFDADGKMKFSYYCAAAKVGHGGVRFRYVQDKVQECFQKQQRKEQEALEKQQRAKAKAARKQAKLEDDAVCPDWDELDW